MKKTGKIATVLLLSIAAIVIIQMVSAGSTGTSISGIKIGTENFKPLIWLCDSRVVDDDNVEQGRNGPSLDERTNNYAFTGERISWRVLVLEKNGITKLKDVFVSIGPEKNARRMETFQVERTRIRTLENGTNVTETFFETKQRMVRNEIQANCNRAGAVDNPFEECGARISQEELTVFNPQTMGVFSCVFTVEPPQGTLWHGEHWVTIEAEDLDGQFAVLDEVEYWFFNPVIAVSVSGDLLSFGDDVRPGTTVYSDTILIGNDADPGSGVLLDMFITGTDFYDPSNSGAKCPTTNRLALTAIRYYTAKGAYSTSIDPRADPEGYVGITYADKFERSFYTTAEIIQAAFDGTYFQANVLNPGSKMPITFKLNLPEPCNGNFESGSLYFWAEAI